MKSAFVSAIDGWLKQQGKYQKSESKITFNDIQDCLVLVSNNFSTQTSYENQTKKAINNKFVQEAMTDFLRAQLEVYFIENPFDAQTRSAEQVLINKRSPGDRGKDPAEHQKEAVRLHGHLQPGAEVRGLPHQGRVPRELYIVEGDSAMGSGEAQPGRGVSRASCPSGARSSTASRPTTPRSSKARSSPTC